MKRLLHKKPTTTPPTTRSTLHVPERLFQAVLLHLFRNLAGHPGPLLLGIHGAPGAGKSFGVTLALRRLGVRAVRLSAGDMESPEAGEPARRVRQAYLAAGRLRDGKTPVPAALILDDVDAALGDWGNLTQYTANRQLVCGELMQLADHPQRVDGRAVRRVPIIVTGNRLGLLYAPLLRPGRMALLEWSLLLEERLRVLGAIFLELEPVEVRKAAVEFADESVAFFADLRRRLVDEHLAAALKGRDPREALRRAARNDEQAGARIDVTLECVLETGRALRASRTMTDHLRQAEVEALACDVLCGRTDS